MRSYGEYCPIAIGAEAFGDRWTPLVLRELIVGSERFSDIHRGVPRMSRTLLAQRLKQLERLGIVERCPGPRYRLTESGRELEPVVWALGDWAMRWQCTDPQKEHYDGTHLMWRVHQGVIPEALPATRTVVEFNFPNATNGRRVWLVLAPEGTSVCVRDEGFDVDLYVTADIGEFLRVWSGQITWSEAARTKAIVFDGPRMLVKAFPRWFALSPFVEREAAVPQAPSPR